MPSPTVNINTIKHGEVAVTNSAAALPSRDGAWVKLKALMSNVGKIYVGGSGVTVPDDSTDTTTGWELSPGEETDWLPCNEYSMDKIYAIAVEASGDSLVYLLLA